MENQATFSYRYSAKENKEIEEIRKKYLPQEESKLDELKRLDSTVQNSGIMQSLCAGVGGALIFGLGMCLAMEVIGGGILLIAFGVILDIVGIVGMLGAYPVYQKILADTKERLAPRIIELANELSVKNS